MIHEHSCDDEKTTTIMILIPWKPTEGKTMIDWMSEMGCRKTKSEIARKSGENIWKWLWYSETDRIA